MDLKRSALVFLLAVLSCVPVMAADRLPSGTEVTIFIEADSNQPEPDPGPPTDILVFTGGRSYSIELLGCSDQFLALQQAILVDADGPRSSRAVSVAVPPIAAAAATVVPAGTRLEEFRASGGCTSGGISYRRYIAKVQ